MRDIATIRFCDAVSSEEAVAIVRADASVVGLCLSLKSDGDLEVFLGRVEALKLVEAIQSALK